MARTVRGPGRRRATVHSPPGGLLVDVEGVNVFLPASQVSIRRTNDISEFIGRDIEARIIKIDPERMNIVVSRRKLLEEERESKKKDLLEKLHEDGKTILMVTHEPEVAEHAEIQLHMRDGEVVRIELANTVANIVGKRI